MSQNWQDISDDELDDLFRKAADEQDIAFEADSWAKMNQKLSDLPASNENSRWKRLLPLLLVLLLSFIGGSYYFMKDSEKSEKIEENNSLNNLSNTSSVGNSIENKVNQKTEVSGKDSENNTKINVETTEKVEPNSTNNENEVARKSEIISASNSSNLKEKSNTVSTVKTVQDKTVLKENTSFKNSKLTAKARKVNNKNVSSESTDNQNITSEKTSTNTSKKSEIIQDRNIENNGLGNSSAINSGNITASEQNIITEPVFTKNELSNLNELVAKHPVFKTSLHLPTISYQSALKPTQTSALSAAFKKGINFRFSVSPDISTVAFNEIRKVGTNIGLLVEYRYNNRWSLQTGLIRSLKIYEAYPEQYTWIWKMPNTPLLDINATCKMFDIPLNIRYDITQKTNSRWFVGAGVTTYRMLEETYIYNYENNDDPSIKWKKWVGSTGSYPFKVINFSSGYEKQFRKNLTFQIEPFVKIPTAKVGFGKVNLSTFGVFLSAKYHVGK